MIIIVETDNDKLYISNDNNNKLIVMMSCDNNW